MDHSWIDQFIDKLYKHFLKKKIQKQKDISKSNPNHAVIIYPHCLERQNLVTTSNVLKTLTTKS